MLAEFLHVQKPEGSPMRCLQWATNYCIVGLGCLCVARMMPWTTPSTIWPWTLGLLALVFVGRRLASLLRARFVTVP